MILHRKKIAWVLSLCCIVFSACTKKWEEHNQITDGAVNNNLFQAVSKTTSLAKFTDLLVKTGYDKIISSSKTYTVWAPTDQALQLLDPAILNDTAKLKLFVGNHISNQSYLIVAAAPDQRIKMLNGKYNLLSGSKFDSANITTANQYAANGIFHIIDKIVPRIDNCWEFMTNSTSVPLDKNYLLSLNYIYNDTSKAIATGVDPITGQTLYDFTNAKVNRNKYLDTVLNLADESNLYTFLLITDNSFTAEYNKLTPMFVTGTPDSTKNLASFHLVKDLAFKGSYSRAELPDTMVSQFGVKVPVNKSAIVASYKTSNGWVHIMNQVNFNLRYKFPSVFIQGEQPTGFATTDRGANTFYRIRTNPNTGQTFNDIMMQNYNYANYFIYYNAKNLNSIKYNLYWVAVNDVQVTPLWQQKLSMAYLSGKTFSSVFTSAYQTVAYQNYNEVSLGQVSLTNYSNGWYFLVTGPTTASSTGGVNSISLDYIRLEPVFP